MSNIPIISGGVYNFTGGYDGKVPWRQNGHLKTNKLQLHLVKFNLNQYIASIVSYVKLIVFAGIRLAFKQ